MTRRRHNPTDSRRYQDWLNAAYDDLRAAELLLQDDTLNNATAFHCQQCAEKALKGYILARDNQAVDGHNLTWLCKRACRIDGEFTQWLDESAALNKCYIETRYPTDIPTEIPDEQAASLVEMTRQMFRYVADELNAWDELDEMEAY
ncbi:MAG TPA: HEPN domain-containing protein [Candidatus Merdivicinus intestinavium]|nr:HEPN domain-containing protein [Candidatus Merdivicinus intestinavium]